MVDAAVVRGKNDDRELLKLCLAALMKILLQCIASSSYRESRRDKRDGIEVVEWTLYAALKFCLTMRDEGNRQRVRGGKSDAEVTF